MLSDFSVEIGPEAPALEIPWSSPDNTQRFYDLKSRPELLLDVIETRDHPELADFLAHINRNPALQSAKCDLWQTRDLDDVEEVFGKPWKYGSYVDVFFYDPALQLQWELHQRFAHELVKKLQGIPDFPGAIELVLRRCYFHRTAKPDESQDGYSYSLFISGFGSDTAEARRMWVIAQELAQNVLLQMAARLAAGQ